MSVTVPLLDDDTIPFGEEEELQDANVAARKYRHPYVVFFHLFFRGAAIVVYMFCGWFTDSFVSSFVCVIFLLSADFWTVKNVTGRLLVGLRWRNYVDDDGSSHWIYESKKMNKTNKNEARIFWFGLILFPILWSLFFMVALLSFHFKWLLLNVMGIALSGANLYGYIKCYFGANKDLNSAATDYVKTQLFKNAFDILARTSSRTEQPTTSQPVNVI